jgi:hypothetical protein
MANRRPQPHQQFDDSLSGPTMDQAFGQRARGGSGWEINKTVSISVIVALFAWTVSGVWFAAQQSAALSADHTAIAQLQANEKDNDKQRVEILLHLSNMDQSLKDILNYGLSPRSGATQVLVPSNSAPQVIMQQAPAQVPAEAGKIEQR